MKLYALIGPENTVSGIVETPSEEQVNMLSSVYGQVIDITNYQPMPQLGWTFDGQQIVGTSASKKITKLAMRQRFTTAEMLGLMSYVTQNPASVVAMLMQNLQVATFVDLARPDTQAGLSYLVAQNLLTSDRANTILNTPPSPLEVYTS